MSKKTITIVVPCFNEADNIGLMIEKLREVMAKYTVKYDHEILIIDDDSTDNTVAIIKAECATDKRIKLIVNSRNF